MAALGLGYLPTGKRSRPGSQRLSVMIQIRNWKPPWQACVLAKFLPIWLSLICGQESWLPFWLITLQHHGICSYTARSRVLYRSGCDWCTTTLSRLSQTPSYFPRAWGHSLNTCQQSSAFGRPLPVSATANFGQVECKRLVISHANEWSVAMQMSGQVGRNFPRSASADIG
ncbi:Uncharacterised protein [Pseudomonas fragi]|uniref:Uncharacterized protein n=1 Tax=Pseudomonas fragi TaxID=296 RepID=A0A449IES4_PSEFR|nr:Uncharacterised protein [Pseudomonas fragi]